MDSSPPGDAASAIRTVPPLDVAFTRNTVLCLDGRITRLSMFPVEAGGFADVFEGHLGSRKVAIKVLRPFKLPRGKLFRRLWREYLTWSRLSHPNILTCLGYSYDFSPQSYTLPALISPWMENGSVLSYLEKYPGADRVALLVGIAEGLSYLHTCEPVIVHGDLRAANILVSDNGTPCLTDFGLSRVLEEMTGMTTSSDLAGCVRWMSPELFSSESNVKISVKSDIWAYGMTALEILSGERPYSTIKNDILVLGHVREGKTPARPRGDKARELRDDRLWSICQHCWSWEPSERPSLEKVTSVFSDVQNKRGGDGRIAVPGAIASHLVDSHLTLPYPSFGFQHANDEGTAVLGTMAPPTLPHFLFEFQHVDDDLTATGRVTPRALDTTLALPQSPPRFSPPTLTIPDVTPSAEHDHPVSAPIVQSPTSPAPSPDVCADCIMRDLDVEDVDVTSPGIWGRESNASFCELCAREEAERGSGVSAPLPHAHGTSLTKENLSAWLFLAPSLAVAKRAALLAYLDAQSDPPVAKHAAPLAYLDSQSAYPVAH